MTEKRKPGRPEIGGRVAVALGAGLLARIDKARGKQTRAAWLRDAAERALPVEDGGGAAAAAGDLDLSAASERGIRDVPVREDGPL